MDQSNKMAFLEVQAQILALAGLKVKLPCYQRTVAPTHFQKQVGRGTWLRRLQHLQGGKQGEEEDRWQGRRRLHHLQGGNGGEEEDEQVSRVLSQERGASYLSLSWNISMRCKYVLCVNMFA